MGKENWVKNTGLIRASVTLSDGRHATIEIEPGRASIDEEGYIRIFSLTYDDGTIGNFKLLPSHPKALAAAELLTNFLASIGLARIGGRLVKGNSTVKDLGIFMASNFGTVPLVHNVFERFSKDDSAYHAFETGELVISHPIRLKRA